VPQWVKEGGVLLLEIYFLEEEERQRSGCRVFGEITFVEGLDRKSVV